uniref:ATP synthase F0 subunit 8 n=1 Tax=Vaejovis mexicanus smithi TaxID=1562928 RepID=A0A343AXY8_VAEMS|nr:ATP synthase F0 subunit 8 [Vaejovis smithi]APW29072.1 ATP synthase F0 subunit 8 [Vaejovis smithi]
MPQMSPLGWAWIILFVSFAYFLFLTIMYYIFFMVFGFYEISVNLVSLNWVW